MSSQAPDRQRFLARLKRADVSLKETRGQILTLLASLDAVHQDILHEIRAETLTDTQACAKVEVKSTR